MDHEDTDGPWWVHCRCGELNGEHPTEADARAAADGHSASDRRCGEISMSACRPGVGFVPMFLLGDDSCTDATTDQEADGQWQVTCSCGALDSLRFLTAQDAQEAMGDHLDAEDDRARALFEQLAGDGFEGRLRRG
ncbi:hypothetical protein [Parafrankia soli]|uniref:hypothetical protein n=2 Tax=Parafrankia soli TaxID=2599596 RepID=UPI0018E312A5|nr:hypothetical protein [Parafrankia soli]